VSRISGLAELVRLMIFRGEVPAGGRIVQLSGDDLADALQVRAALEARSAGLAAERVRAYDVPLGALARLESETEA
jgi:hypothetical protein